MAKAHEKPTDDSIKDTLESIVIAFVLAFLFRAYVVEAFVIPTGSMAPTLLGAHLTATCQQCGYEFTVDSPDRRLPANARALCPMCRFPNPPQSLGAARSGDRILVQKYVYDFTEPTRWDVVVFKAPHKPEQNYIKRLVGLPGEELAILDGNLYARPNGGDWHVARKTNRPEVQRRVFQPIYDSQYRPLDGGEDQVLSTPRGERHTRPAPVTQWAHPWVADEPGAWEIDGRRSYRHKGQDAGWLRFDFSRGHYHTERSRYPYNQFKRSVNPRTPDHQPEPIEDIRLAVTLEPEQAGATVKLQTTARLDNPKAPGYLEKLTATIDAGKVTLSATDPETDATRQLATQNQPRPLPAGEVTRLELWYVDQEAILWLDGQPVARYGYNLSLDQLKARPAPQPTPDLGIQVTGQATLHRVELDRDLYYSNDYTGTDPGRAALRRSGDGVIGEPFQLNADQFFCLGDNSPHSQDSRFWDPANPWIRQKIFQGQPQPGIVPRKLMVGRAFFVYWPASYGLTSSRSGIPLLPNFGDMRFIK
jgi:signal peptidase I